MKSSFFLILLFFFLASQGYSQNPKKRNATELYEALQKLNFLGSVLYVAAHPDDENTRLISYLSKGVKARTAYLSLTRGDGGQNLIGPEIRELLGVIRTQELLTARDIDGGQQFFTRANDFGYSKHPDETLAIWDRTEVLSDVVWTIRNFKPDVIINRFDHRTPGTTHGHHTASAMLSVVAYELAGDKKSYANHLQHTGIWQPQRLFFNTSWWFYGSEEKFEKADKSNCITFDIGNYYPALGLSNTEIAALSRSQHKSQGFGKTGTRGSKNEYLELIKGSLPKDPKSIFEGIDTSWNRVVGGVAIGKIIATVIKEFDFKNPSASVPKLMSAHQLITQLKDRHWRTIKLAELENVISGCLGLYLEAAATAQHVAISDTIAVSLEAINRSTIPVKLLSIRNGLNNDSINSNELLTNNSVKTWETEVLPSTDTGYSPYWLQETGSLGMYRVENQKHIGMPINAAKQFYFDLEVDGKPLTCSRPLIYKKNDPVKGEVYKPFETVPALSVALEEDVLLFINGTPKTIDVNVTAHKANLKGAIRLQIPKGWSCMPTTLAFELHQIGQEYHAQFLLTPPDQQHEGLITPIANIDNQEYTKEVVTVDYDHIPFQTAVLPAVTKVVRLEINKKGAHIGYIEGAGDAVAESLRQIGYQVTTINPNAISRANLVPFDAIVMGIRAYNTIEALKFKQPILLEYVKNGGNLIVQYNTNKKLKTEHIAPFELQLSRDRVTDEHAKINFLDSQHPILNSPNKITAQDFEGWVQERGLYFPNAWGKEFKPILAIHDQGESPKKGSLLVAKYGKGNYIYTGLSFFREFPAGVPGAYRLFANLLSLGKS